MTVLPRFSRRIAPLFSACLVAAGLSAPIAACGDSTAPLDGPSTEDDAGTAPDPFDAGPGQETDASTPTKDGGRPLPNTPPLDLTGVEPGKWAWFEFPETLCRDGSKAGIGLNVSPSGSKKVVFELEGGGACFNALTCIGNFGKVEHKDPGGGGMFDRTKPENPFAEYTFIHVPYCTGDVHAGNRRDVNVGGAGKQQFVGYANATFFLEKVAVTFQETERLVMAGPSAGGFGASANFGQALRIFPTIPVNLVDDSGPLLADPFSDCLQTQWKNLWGFEQTILADCGADCAGQVDYLRAAAKHWASVAKNATGLISATGDSTIRLMASFGANNCGIPSTPSEAKYAEGLQDLKTHLAPHPKFGMFLYGGTNHTVLTDNRFYDTKVGDTTTAQWVRSIIENDTVTNVGP